MKHLKMLGLLVVAAASLMAFAASAYATPVLTSPAGTPYTGELHATLSGTALLKAGIEETCTESTVKGSVETNNESGASGKFAEPSPSGVSFGGCKGTTDVLSSVGTLSINDSGEVTATGVKVTVEPPNIAVSCVYGASTGTKLGTLTTGSPAKLNVNTTQLPKIEGGIFCAEKGTWTANYTVTTPTSLFIT